MNRKDYLTPPQVAKILGVNRRAVTQWINKKQIKYIQPKTGGHYLIYKDDVTLFSKIRDIVLTNNGKIPMYITDPDYKTRLHYYNLFKKDFGACPIVLNEYYIQQLKKIRPLFILMDINWVHFQVKEIIKQIKSDPELDYMAIIVTTKLYTKKALVEFLDLGVDQFLPKDIGDRELIARIRNILLLKFGFNAI